MIHILAKRPDLQRELQKEMDTVIGSEREPRLSDRGDCPRIESFILETLRYISHLPLFVFHAASQSTSIGGYDVEIRWYLNSLHYPKHPCDQMVPLSEQVVYLV